MTDLPWWSPERHADRRPILLARNRILGHLRRWFEGQGFTEVDPAALQVSPGNEAHLHAFRTTALGPDLVAAERYLHTSPEFALKKLLSAGETRIFAFTHVWRNRERGPLHAPEFTMLEWYRAGEDYAVLIEDCARILEIAAEEARTDRFRHGGIECDPFARPERLSVGDAFRQFAGIDLLGTLDAAGAPSERALREACGRAGIGVAADDTWSDMMSKALVACVEPRLGHGRSVALDRYPAVEAALARRAPDDPRVAERFELYACGVELANGFGELTDPAEQRRRFHREMDEKSRIYGDRYPLDEDFLAALETMPPASGIALGFDRLVMLATGAPRVEDVMWAPPA